MNSSSDGLVLQGRSSERGVAPGLSLNWVEPVVTDLYNAFSSFPPPPIPPPPPPLISSVAHL